MLEGSSVPRSVPSPYYSNSLCFESSSSRAWPHLADRLCLNGPHEMLLLLWYEQKITYGCSVQLLLTSSCTHLVSITNNCMHFNALFCLLFCCIHIVVLKGMQIGPNYCNMSKNRHEYRCYLKWHMAHLALLYKYLFSLSQNKSILSWYTSQNWSKNQNEVLKFVSCQSLH